MVALEEEELLDQLEGASVEALELSECVPLRVLLLAVGQQRLGKLRLASDLDGQLDGYLQQTDTDSQRMQELGQFYLVVLAVPGWENPP